MPNPEDISSIEKAIVDSAIKVYRTLGPGLLASAYQACLIYELNQHGSSVVCDVVLPVECNSIKINKGFSLDMLVDDKVIIRNISESSSLALYELEMKNHLSPGRYRSGYILNWKNLLKRNGIKHVTLSEKQE